MVGLGTMANMAAILIGSIFGIMIKGGLKKRFQETIMKALGLAVMFIGISGALQGLLKVKDGGLETIYQGIITLSAKLVEPYLNDRLISEISFIGSILIFGIGINMIFGKKIKCGNILPAVLIPIVYEVINKLF